MGAGILILNRRIDEGFWVGEAYVVVLGIERGRAKIGIDAPTRIAVSRDDMKKAPDGPTPLRASGLSTGQ